MPSGCAFSLTLVHYSLRTTTCAHRYRRVTPAQTKEPPKRRGWSIRRRAMEKEDARTTAVAKAVGGGARM